jgi:hypothetical protein
MAAGGEQQEEPGDGCAKESVLHDKIDLQA